ncbi:MAG: hypothetical protein J3K34DRAFT_469596 [Monoraphidium minutum]|nr:MAG: hypothetical protein J3K34DRAFT_469596 [Monoraphidium minutum]
MQAPPELQLLAEAHMLQQQLMDAAADPLLALPAAAGLVLRQLDADACAIWAFPAPSAAALMAACGPDAACAALGRAPGDALPQDLRRFSAAAGLQSLAYVPIGSDGDALGTLLVAKTAPRAFSGSLAQARLQAVAAGVAHHLSQPTAAAMARLMQALDAAPDTTALVSILLQAAPRFLARAAGPRAAVRLALLESPAPSAPRRALLLDPWPRGAGSAPPRPPPLPLAPAPPGNTNGGAAPPAGGAVLPGDAFAGVAATWLALEGTLLASALNKQEARFVADVPGYLQSCAAPAGDVAARPPGAPPAASLVVVPLVGRGAALGALYLLSGAPCGYEPPLKDALLGFVYCVSGVLHTRLAGKVAALGAAAAGAQ